MYVKNLIMVRALLLSVFVLLFSSSFAFAQDSVGEKDASMESHLLFLKDTTVLLEKRNQRMSAAFSVLNDEQSVFSTTGSRRAFSLAYSYSVGVGYGAEAFVSAPVSYTKTKNHDFLFADGNSEKTKTSFDSATLGLKKTLLRQGARVPEVVGAMSFSYDLRDKEERWSAKTFGTLNITAITYADPVVLYGGVSYNHPFGQGSGNFGLRFGSAFAVNHKVALGGELSITNTPENERTLSPVSMLTVRETYTGTGSNPNLSPPKRLSQKWYNICIKGLIYNIFYANAR